MTRPSHDEFTAARIAGEKRLARVGRPPSVVIADMVDQQFVAPEKVEPAAPVVAPVPKPPKRIPAEVVIAVMLNGVELYYHFRVPAMDTLLSGQSTDAYMLKNFTNMLIERFGGKVELL